MSFIEVQSKKQRFLLFINRVRNIDNSLNLSIVFRSIIFFQEVFFFYFFIYGESKDFPLAQYLKIVSVL